MGEIFTEKYHLLWALLLAVALFFPVRQLIWVLSIRRVQRKTGEDVDTETQRTLRNRASTTAGLLCLIVSYLYTSTWWGP